MAWVQFAFPTCPSCSQSWVGCRHRDCVVRGSLELDPDARYVRCDACNEHWGVWDTAFYCSCGHQFQASEVDDALQQILYAAQLLAGIIESHRRELNDIRMASESSFRSWLSGIAEGLGGSLGGMLGKLVGSFVQALFGR